MSELIGLDFETYSATDLPTHGLERYVSCPTFQPLLASTCGHVGNGGRFYSAFDFVNDDTAVERLSHELYGKTIVAHNADFERRVLRWLGIDLPAKRFIDSAVVARAAGAGSKLEAAAPQLLNVDKMEEGRHLIRLFSMPGKYQEENGHGKFDPRIIEDHSFEWRQFLQYCQLDAKLGLRIAAEYLDRLTEKELGYAAVTMEMNDVGWPVDIELVEEMNRRYLENQQLALTDFLQTHDPFVGTEQQLNLNSLKQLKEWCAKRGIRTTSFDEKHVAALQRRIEKKLDTMSTTDPKYLSYHEVLALLKTKQILGRSSLKKLRTILDTAVEGRLKGQYLHCGAGQTLRTSGRSVQMQNLKRLGGQVEDVSVLIDDPDSEWNNEQLAKNIRQVFTASEKGGRLIVGDFSSVESRGLAYLAKESWKLDSYRQGDDLYKVLASKIYNVPYENVDKGQRQVGKVGELSCGYGAGSGAVLTFAENMGVTMSEGEAQQLVNDWRQANPEIVRFWQLLDEMLHAAVAGAPSRVLFLHDGLRLQVRSTTTPESLLKQHPGAQSIMLQVMHNDGTVFLRRYFHGCYERGRNVCYYKPSERKTGDLWRQRYMDPKTKQLRFYELYGGKLAGILTQSFCRELFFQSLHNVHDWCQRYESVTLVGQFHDEIVVDWRPHDLTLAQAKADLERMMSDPGRLKSFPLAAEIKDDYRYTK